MSENEKNITEGLEKNIEVVDAPKEAKKTEKVPRIIKLASSTFGKVTKWFGKKLINVQTIIKEKQIERAENNLANKEFQRVNEEKEKVEKYIYKKALKYEKLKDQLELLITKGYNKIPKKVDIPVEKRAINLKNAMFKALKYNGSGWVIDPDKRDEVFSINDRKINTDSTTNEENINFNTIDEELRKHKKQENEDNNINTNSSEKNNTNVVNNTYINPDEVLAITQKGLYGYKKDNIIQDLPINSVEEQEFNTVGMTNEEIDESMKKIEEYKAVINNDEKPEYKIVNDSDEKTEENIHIESNQKEEASTEIREDGTKVVISADRKSKMYEFNTNNNEKESKEKTELTVVEPKENQNQEEPKIDLNINELKGFREQLAKLSEQRQAVEQAKQKASEERLAAEQAVQAAKMKAQQAKESYIERINREKAEIEAINSDINNMTSDIQKNQQAAKMANEYAQAIEQMISGETTISEEKGNSK